MANAAACLRTSLNSNDSNNTDQLHYTPSLQTYNDNASL